MLENGKSLADHGVKLSSYKLMKISYILSAAGRMQWQTLVTYYIQQARTSRTDSCHLYHYSTSNRFTLPAKHHRPMGFLCGWSVGVEFFARLLVRYWCWQRQIQTSENVYVRFILAHTAH